MLDCFDCSEHKLSSAQAINEILENFPAKIGMNKISPPYVFRTGNGEKGGLSGVVLLAESHLTVHTFPEKKQAFVDVFSCREFNLRFAADYLSNYFEAGRHEVKLPAQKMDFPPHSRVAAEILHSDRKNYVAFKQLYQ